MTANRLDITIANLPLLYVNELAGRFSKFDNLA